MVSSWAHGDDPVQPHAPVLPLPVRTPAGFDAANFEALGPNWEAWSAETVETLRQLYEESADLESQEKSLTAVRKRLAIIDKALADPRYRMIRLPLLDLQAKISRRFEIYDALHRLLTAPRSAATNGTSPIDELRTALNDLESSLLVIPQGANWLPYLRSDELHTIIDSGELTDASRETLRQVSAKLTQLDNVSDVQRKFLQQEMFRRLAHALDRAVVAVPNQSDDEWRTKLRDTATTLLISLEEYEATGNRSAAVTARAAFEQIQSLGGTAADPLTSIIRAHYFNYNLNIAASEAFLSRFVEQRRSESGQVNEYVQDVRVYGCQWTNTRVSIDLKPSDRFVRFDLVLDGDVQSRTTGEVSSATVYTSGTATFRAEKEVRFDGDTYQLYPARIGVRASNNTYDAETCLEWLPLARGIARGIALSKAADKKPEADAYTRNKISTEVRGRFDRETSTQFADAQQNLTTKVHEPLREVELYPELVRVSSTSDDAIIRSRLMQDGQMAATRPPQTASPRGGVLVQIHQSLLCNGVDRMDFAGQKLTQTQVNEKITDTLKKVLKNQDFRNENQRPDDGTLLVFDTVDPIGFHIENDTVTLSMRAGLERPGEEDIPTQIITVPMKLQLVNDQIVMTRGSVGVRPAQRPPNIREQIVRAQIMRGRIQDNIPETKTRDARLTLDQNGKTIAIKVRSLHADDGWLTLVAE